MRAIGIMSGTSLDGVDVVLCNIDGVDQDTVIKELAFKTYPFTNGLDTRLSKIITNKYVDLKTLCSINFELGEFFADCCIKLCSQMGMALSELDFIASHGQTLYHIGEEEENIHRSSIQLGEASVIAEKCGCKVISNFRAKDISVGGQGAPLVPFSEYILYSNSTKNIGLQNIGGIGNITVLPSSGKLNEVIAFDTGPGNMMINAAMNYLFHKKYDEGGRIASKGKVNRLLKHELLSHPYLKLVPPKSTGRELFGDDYTHYLIQKYPQIKPEDFIATLTWYTAYCIYDSYQKYISPNIQLDQLIIGGGGAHNITLLQNISALLPQIEITTQDRIGMSSDSKEAVAFVILGNQTIHRRPSNIPSVTGASKSVILGQVTDGN